MNYSSARQAILRHKKQLTCTFDKYRLRFRPHLLASTVRVTAKSPDSLCGEWLLAQLPPPFVIALGTAAQKAQKPSSRPS